MPLDIAVVSELLGIVLGSVVLGVVLTVIKASIGVRLNNWHSADSGFEPWEGHYLALDMTRMIADLSNLGFAVRGHWQLTCHFPATGQVTLMEHPRTRDVAKVVVTEAGTRRNVVLMFQTRFEDGTEIATANPQHTVGLPSLPEITVLWLLELRDAEQLYHVHTKVTAFLGVGKKRRAVGHDPAAFLSAGQNRMYAHWVESGYYYFDERRRVYRPTWKGALLMTGRLVWPIQPLYRAWRRRPTRKLLGELGVRLEPY